jgi:hypothetical protein
MDSKIREINRRVGPDDAIQSDLSRRLGQGLRLDGAAAILELSMRFGADLRLGDDINSLLGLEIEMAGRLLDNMACDDPTRMSGV